MTVKAIHLFVYEDRHGIWEMLGLPNVPNATTHTQFQNQLTTTEDGNKLNFSILVLNSCFFYEDFVIFS